MNVPIDHRSARGAAPRRLAGACALAALLLAGCSDDGAGSGGLPSGGASQNPPAAGSGAPSSVSIVVSGAVPVSGNAAVSGTGATSTAVTGTTRRVTASGAGNGLQHRFTVEYDGITGTVLAVTHDWGAGGGNVEAATLCVRSAAVVGQAPCGDTVAVEPLNRRVVFSGTVLRGAGTFTSILTGQVVFTVP